MGGTEAGEKRVAGERRSLGRAETLKGRILRRTPRFGGDGTLLTVGLLSGGALDEIVPCLGESGWVDGRDEESYL